MAVTVAFSSDESTITVNDPIGSYLIPRPIKVSWSLNNFQIKYGITTWYYISPTGSDSNSGLSRGAPLATMQHFILNFFSPGNGLIFLPGTYTDACITNTANAGPPGNGGTASNYIVMTCDDLQHGGGLGSVIIQIDQNHSLNGWPLDSQSTSVINIFNTNYLILNGLTLQGAIGQPWASPMGTPCGIKFSNGTCNGCIIQNCVNYLNQHCGIKDQSQTTTNVQLLANVNCDNGLTSLDHGNYWACPGPTTITGHLSFNNTGFGEHYHSTSVGVPTNQVTSYCLTFGNESAGGDGGYALGGNAVTCVLHHCTSGDLRGRGFFHEGSNIGGGNAGQWNEYANIGWGTKANGGVGGLDFDSITSGPTVDHCDCDFYSSSNWPTPLVTNCLGMPSQIGLDPLFANIGIGDFRLRIGSPCIGAAVDGTNMGCYQATPITAPVNLSTTGRWVHRNKMRAWSWADIAAIG